MSLHNDFRSLNASIDALTKTQRKRPIWDKTKSNIV